MKIKSNDNTQLRNDEHFQFQTEFRDLVNAAGAETLKIKSLFDAYLPCYNDEDEAFRKIAKSAITADVEAADQLRDTTFRGLTGSNKAALNHYDAETGAAARRLKVLFDTYGNLAVKPLNEETSALYNLLQELTGAYAQDIQTAGLTGWVNKLDADNKAFAALVKMRNDENAAKTQLKMKETRAAVDKAYATIVERINALIIVEGKANYSDFVNKLNGYIEKYNNTLAQRLGRYAAGKKEKN
jgi:hypothetical protein